MPESALQEYKLRQLFIGLGIKEVQSKGVLAVFIQAVRKGFAEDGAMLVGQNTILSLLYAEDDWITVQIPHHGEAVATSEASWKDWTFV